MRCVTPPMKTQSLVLQLTVVAWTDVCDEQEAGVSVLPLVRLRPERKQICIGTKALAQKAVILEGHICTHQTCSHQPQHTLTSWRCAVGMPADTSINTSPICSFTRPLLNTSSFPICPGGRLRALLPSGTGAPSSRCDAPVCIAGNTSNLSVGSKARASTASSSLAVSSTSSLL